MTSGAYDGANRDDYFQGVGRWFTAYHGCVIPGRACKARTRNPLPQADMLCATLDGLATATLKQVGTPAQAEACGSPLLPPTPFPRGAPGRARGGAEFGAGVAGVFRLNDPAGSAERF